MVALIPTGAKEVFSYRGQWADPDRPLDPSFEVTKMRQDNLAEADSELWTVKALEMRQVPIGSPYQSGKLEHRAVATNVNAQEPRPSGNDFLPGNRPTISTASSISTSIAGLKKV